MRGVVSIETARLMAVVWALGRLFQVADEAFACGAIQSGASSTIAANLPARREFRARTEPAENAGRYRRQR
jgi:hypothetical protein